MNHYSRLSVSALCSTCTSMLMQILESSSDREEWQVGIPDTESPAQEKEQLEGEFNS